MSGWVDLHCHLLFGLDDGASTVQDSLEMARVLVELGFEVVAPSPHARPRLARKEAALARLAEVREALRQHNVPLRLEENAENFLLDEELWAALGTPSARLLGRGPWLLVEAPYHAPVPSLADMLFRFGLKGIKPLLAHPERCLEFERPGRAAEAVRGGAALQLDLGSLVGRYGSKAKQQARLFLEQGLYAVAASDLHSADGAAQWLREALLELRRLVGEQGVQTLLRDRPQRLLSGEALES